MIASSSNAPVRLFFGYHSEDESFYKELRRHLAALVGNKNKKVDIQHSGGVPAGEVQRTFLENTLAEAQVIVLLVTPALIDDDLWWAVWTPVVDESHQKTQRLVPVRVRRADLSDTSLAGRELLPRDARSLATCPDRDEVWSDIAKEIRTIVDGLREATPLQPVQRAEANAGTTTALEDVKRRKAHAYNLRYRGRGKEALEELHLALNELDALTGEDPDGASVKTERAHLHDRIAQCECAQGRFDAARAAFDLAFDIRTALCTSRPDDAEALRDLSASRFWRGYLSYLQGDLSRAWDEQREGMLVCRNLCERDAGDVKAARSLVVLQTDLGTTLWELGDRAGAEEHLRGSLVRARALAKQNPDNRQIQRDVSVGLFRLADFLVALGQSEEATGLCVEAVQMCWALSERAPDNVQWRRHVATARISMGDVRVSRNELSLARADYEFAAGTMGAFAALEQENLEGLRHHANSERKLADLLDRAEDHVGAMAAYARADSAMAAACTGTTSARWDRERQEIHSALQRAKELVPGADRPTAREV